MKTKRVVCLLLCLGLAAPVFAELIASESFNYPLGEPMEGKNGGFGWADGWQIVDLDPEGMAAVGEPLTVSGVPAVGNGLRLVVDNTNNEAGTGVFRNLNQEIGAAGTTFWGSILCLEAVEISNSDFFIQLGAGNQWMAPGRAWWYQFSIDNNRSGIQQQVGQTYQLVFRMDCNGGDSKCYLWVDPDMTEEPDIADAHVTQTGDFAPGTMFRVRCNRYDDQDMIFDEIRLGTEFEDVQLRDKSKAGYPVPDDSLTDVPRDNVVLEWRPGQFADTHDIYFSDNFADVNEGIALESEGHPDPMYPLGRLDFGKTYYWRVDEVNAPPSDGVYEGFVWSFEVEPEGYPVAVSELTVSVSSDASEDGDPNVLIDGTGLDADGNHSIDSTTMWKSGPSEAGEAWVQVDMADMKKLSGLRVWNHNTDSETIPGFSNGMKEVKVEYSDGSTWMEFGLVEIPQATGNELYAGSVIDLGGLYCQAVKITAMSKWGVFPLDSFGLAEVQLLAMPMAAREMQPADGSTVNPMDAMLSWRAGREADIHDVYLSTDVNAVMDGTAPKVSAPNTSVSPDLELDQTYYWKVVEVNDVENPQEWEGPVQSFNTTANIVVDDMESYKNKEGFYIWATWKDGYDNQNQDNGALVGNGNDGVPETSIVYEGAQSLPMEYGVNGQSDSWATNTFGEDADWSLHGIKSLSLYIYGEPTNQGGSFYVKVNDKKYNYEAAADDLKAGQWVPFTLNLTDVTTVSSLTIGMAGGSGKIYVDNIRLYPLESVMVNPTTPEATELLAHYPLNGDYDDVSPNKTNGTPMGGAGFANDAARGQVLSLNGVDACVDLGSAVDGGFNFAGSFTLSAWINLTDWYQNWGHVIIGNNGEPFGWQLRRWGGTPNLAFTLRGTDGNDDPIGSTDVTSFLGQWIQVTAIYDSEAGVRQCYVNGVLDMETPDSGTVSTTDHKVYIGARSMNDNSGPNAFFAGMVDDVRVYNRALSHAEVLSLAERTAPMYKAFPE